MKYIIDIPKDNISDFLTLGDDKKLRLPVYNKDGTFNSFILTNLMVIPYTEPDRKTIEDEVWQFAKDIYLKNFIEDGCLYGYISEFDTYQEAKEKHEACKKQKEAIHVGDEVKSKNKEWGGVVTNVDQNGDLIIMDDSGETGRFYKAKHFEKTGRHFTEIEELLKKMKEES